MTDRSVSMYFYLRIHKDELSKTNLLRHILRVFSRQKFLQLPYLVAIWISSMCLLGTSIFVQILLKTILLSVLSRQSNHHWDCEIWDPDRCLTEETSPVAYGSVSLGDRFSTFRYIAAKPQRHVPTDLKPHPSGSFFSPPVDQLQWSWAVTSYTV